MNTNTFDALQSLFLHDLDELRQLQKHWWFTWSMTRVVKEEHLGRCCYLAEEFLSEADLCTLKQKLGLDERQWHDYKAKVSSS
jgi:hypothetical protein